MSYKKSYKTKLFLEKENTEHLIRKQYIYSKEYYPDISLSLVKGKVIEYMPLWSKENSLDNYLSLAGNWEEELSQINEDFVENLHYKLIKLLPNRRNREFPETNVFREKKLVGNNDPYYGEYRLKKNYIDMTADDYKTIDVWRNQNVVAMSKNYRGGNKIPVWQRHVSTRHLDKSNDGLVHRNPDLASYRNQIRGYNMSSIIDGTKTRIKPDSTKYI